MFFSRRAGSKYTDRDNVASVDFLSGDLTKDGAWHELDLSSIIPAGTKLVMLRTLVIGLATIAALKVKTKTNADDINVDVSSMETTGSPKEDTLWVKPDADGVIEYWLSAVSYVTITLTVGGWFK